MGMQLRMGMGLSRRRRQGGGAPAAPSYKVVATRGGQQWATQQGAATTNLTGEARNRQRITAADLPAVRMLYSNWAVRSTTPWDEFENPDAVEFQAALEADATSAYAKMRVGGVDALSMPAGALEYISDDITSTSLGLGATFPYASIIWPRTSVRVPTEISPKWLQGGAAARLVGEFAARHNPATRQAWATGAMALAASGSNGQRSLQPSAIIGLVPSTYKAMVGLGDSWMAGQTATDDTTGEGYFGYLQQACAWDGARVIASFNAGRSSDSVQDYVVGRSRRKAMYKYATHGVITYGINDFVNHPGTPAATTVANLKTAVADMKAEGIQKVALTTLAPRTTGTFTTLAGQAVAAGWEVYRQAVNAGIWAMLMAGEIDAVLDASSILQDPTDNTKWRIDGGAWGDGVHPTSPRGQDAMTAALRVIMTAWGFFV